ncbi:acetylcholine receptor subunit beta-like 1 [Dreissena polymorpha]|uniref:Neurotransmitter-gated ion-channel ligand-binding domain-containing protein n=1 Tax=Dreissena polymorpha TaxID=45954 RepID=A0A9D4N4A3_DREPO|nr:acetylcholine receptor subunit beta-like 1 [Dreissena polymorpha]KAH3886467.1 hypothetical protein DPMN_010477 [Dreissena polymorpha]
MDWKNVFILYVYCLVMFGHVCYVESQGYDDAQTLLTYLFTAYDKSIRPIDKQTDAVNVTVDFNLLSVNDVNELSGALKTTGFLDVKWNDTSLNWTWNGDANTLSFYHWPQNEVWKPDLTLKNSFLNYKSLGDSSLLVENNYTGEMTWHPFQVFESTCSFDITYFPFDIQNCDLIFTSWSYTKTQLNLQVGTNGLNLAYYEANSDWDLKSVSWSSSEGADETSVTFSIKIKRKPLYVLVTIVLPIIFLCILDLFTFVLPCSSGEKIGYSMIVFLSFAIFLTIASTTLPQSSESTAIMTIFVILQTAASMVIVIVSVLLVRINNFSKSTRIPCPIIATMRVLKCRVCNTKVDTSDSGSIDSDGEEVPFTWKDVADMIDIFCFLLFAGALALSTLICLNMASVGI